MERIKLNFVEMSEKETQMDLSGYKGKAFYFELGEWYGYAMEDSIEIYNSDSIPIYIRDNPTKSVEISKLYAEEVVNRMLNNVFLEGLK